MRWYNYDDGRIDKTIDDVSGFETTSLYDEFFRLVGTEQSIDLDGDGSTEQVATDTEFDILGRQKATIDANQNRTTYSYNGVGQLISTLFDDGSSTSTIYNDLGQRKRSFAGVRPCFLFSKGRI